MPEYNKRHGERPSDITTDWVLLTMQKPLICLFLYVLVYFYADWRFRWQRVFSSFWHSAFRLSCSLCGKCLQAKSQRLHIIVFSAQLCSAGCVSAVWSHVVLISPWVKSMSGEAVTKLRSSEHRLVVGVQNGTLNQVFNPFVLIVGCLFGHFKFFSV